MQKKNLLSRKEELPTRARLASAADFLGDFEQITVLICSSGSPYGKERPGPEALTLSLVLSPSTPQILALQPHREPTGL